MVRALGGGQTGEAAERFVEKCSLGGANAAGGASDDQMELSAISRTDVVERLFAGEPR